MIKMNTYIKAILAFLKIFKILFVVVSIILFSNCKINDDPKFKMMIPNFTGSSPVNDPCANKTPSNPTSLTISTTSSPDTNDFKFIFSPANPENNLHQKGNGFGWSTWTPSVTQAIYTNACTYNTDGDIDSGWNMEMKIPFSVLGVTSISPDQIIGFTFYINDDDLVAFSGDQHMFKWTSGTVHDQPNTWGILKF
jgi:hypothetical protein